MLDVENRHMVKALERTVADSAGAVDQLMAVAADFVRPADSAAQTRAQLRIVSVPTGAKVAVDGMAISPTPVTVPVAPGAHEVVATVPDLGTERRLVKAGPGETRVSFRFIEPTATPEAVVEELPDLVLDWRFWGGLGSISAAAIGAAGFLHFGTEANADRSQAMQLLNSAELGPNSAPAFTSEQRDRYQNLQSSFEQNNSYRYSCFFAAITAGIAGGVLFHLWAADGATVAPTPNGVAVSGTF